MPRSHGYRPWTAQEDKILRDDHRKGITAAKTAERLNRSIGSVQMRRQRLAVGGEFGAERPPIDETPAIDDRIDGEQRSLDSLALHRIVTLEEMLAATCVDLNEWEVERHVLNKWEVGAKDPDGNIVVEPLFQVKVWLRRKAGTALAAHVDRLMAHISTDTAARQRAPAVRPASRQAHGAHMLECCLFDLHLGKLAWAPEAGDHYDSKIAEQVARDALADLLWQAERYPIDRVLLPIGNDYFHVDTGAGSTTAGTIVDRDTRYHHMFELGRGLASWMIDLCAQVAPVVVPVVPGNHDELSAFTLGTVLAAEFKHDARVTIDNSPRLRKYQRWGANLIGYTHGKDERLADLPGIMATERPQEWGETVCREWHIGHRHRPKQTTSTPVDGKNGVRVREITSLSGSDAWHTRMGYVGEPKGAEAFVWRFSGGVRAHLYHLADRAHYGHEAAA